MTPELVRRACWSKLDSPQEYLELFRAGGAREWQCELVLPVVMSAREVQPQPAEDQSSPAQ